MYSCNIVVRYRGYSRYYAHDAGTRRVRPPRGARPAIDGGMSSIHDSQSVSQSVSQSFSYYLFHGPTPRAHPSTGSQSGSAGAAPVQPQDSRGSRCRKHRSSCCYLFAVSDFRVAVGSTEGRAPNRVELASALNAICLSNVLFGMCSPSQTGATLPIGERRAHSGGSRGALPSGRGRAPRARCARARVIARAPRHYGA